MLPDLRLLARDRLISNIKGLGTHVCQWSGVVIMWQEDSDINKLVYAVCGRACVSVASVLGVR